MKTLSLFLVLISTIGSYAQEVDFAAIMKDTLHTAIAIKPIDTLSLDDGSFRTERYYIQDSVEIEFRITAGSEELKGFFENQMVPFLKKREKEGGRLEHLEEEEMEGYIWTDRGAGGCLMYAPGKQHYLIVVSSFRDDLDFFKAFYAAVDFSPLFQDE